MEKSKKRILYVIWSLDQGGAEQVVMNLAQTIKGYDFEPMICCLNGMGRYAPGMTAIGIEVCALNKKGRVDINCVLKLKALIKAKKIDLVHTHLFTANLWGRIAARMANVPCVITDHNVDLWKKQYHFMIDWFLLRWTASAVCVSNKVRDFYEVNVKGHKNKGLVIYNGIDVNKFKKEAQVSNALRRYFNLSEEAVLIGIIGRLVPQKAHLDFLECIRILKQSTDEDVHGIIIGEGPEQDRIQTVIDEKNLRECVHLTGFKQNMAEIYSGLDFFVLPSYHEGFPMTILEAMAAQLPVVASDVGGVAECVDHNNNGIVVTPGKPQEIVNSILELISNAGFRKKVTQQAYTDVIQKFSKEVMTERHKKLYLDIIENARKPLT